MFKESPNSHLWDGFYYFKDNFNGITTWEVFNRWCKEIALGKIKQVFDLTALSLLQPCSNGSFSSERKTALCCTSTCTPVYLLDFIFAILTCKEVKLAENSVLTAALKTVS